MNGFLQFLRNLGTGRLVLLAAVGFGLIGFFMLIIGRWQTSPMTTLYSDLDPANAATIVERLESEQIPYETDAGGRILRVPRDQVDRLRLTLAGEGLTGSIVGKEIFDQDSGFGRTSFELNVNYVRAVEGEVARTIKSLSSVSEARVHIVMPERRPFQREASEPSASILIRTNGAGLTRREAQAIQSLVATAVPGLSPERVTISDTTGRLLTDGAAERGQLGGFSNMEEARLAKERLYRDKIEQLLARRVGEGRVRAEVAVTMDNSRTTTSQVTYDPDTQVVLSSNVIEEESEDSDQVGGQVTMANNLPDAQGMNPNPSSTSSKTQETTNFENSKTETVTVREPGTLTQIRVAVLVDGERTLDAEGNTTNYAERGDDEIEQLRNLVLTAIPYNEDRGDLVTVASMRFVDPAPFEASEAAFSFFGLNKNDLIEIVTEGGIFVVIILLILLVVRPLVMRIIEAIPDAPPPPDPSQIEDRTRETPAIAGPVTGNGITPELMALAASGNEDAALAIRLARESGQLSSDTMRTDAKIDVAQVEGRIQESAIKKVADIIRANPDESVAIVRTWLYAD
ncbi:flagellar basal-body MS-ring/collar protein FliF [Kordiimonas gwangyangensis]|uniref:flagellar basal-body MS-ring/collar protein FliF n=1 Tax=Kordiimonas gwangyangensis TaxID=288022 RepID=UPI0004779A00|nr:flagellar basal-body MS-ring/collar protein FliF [Kordiimonas gwangyangensis]